MRDDPGMRKSERSGGIDFLKFLASICIVFHHFQQVCGTGFDYGINFYGDGDRFGWGYLVQFFFMVSGYFMHKYMDRIAAGTAGTFSAWMGKRARRLLPVIAVSVLGFELLSFCYMKLYGQYWGGTPLSIIGALVTALGLQGIGIFPNPFINNPTWFVSVLLLCYGMFYLVAALAGKMKCAPWYFCIAMVLLGVSIAEMDLNRPLMNYQVGYGYFAFFTGLLLADYVQKYGITKKNILCSVLVIAAVLYLFFTGNQTAANERIYIQTFLLYPAVIILAETDAIRGLFRGRLWSGLGKISFGIYIWHSPLMILMYICLALAGWYPDFSRCGYMYIFAAASVLAGSLSYCFLERPLDAWICRVGQSLRARKQQRESEN